MTLAAVWLSAGFLAVAAWQDCRSYRIPNWLSLAVAVLAVSHAAWSGGVPGLPWVEVLLLFFSGLLLWRAGIVGAGDVKLLCACSLWFPYGLGRFLFLVACFGGIQALAVLIPAKLYGWDVSRVPYGVAISAAGIVLLAATFKLTAQS